MNVKTSVNLRKGSSTYSAILTSVPMYTAVQATGEITDNFMRVEYNGMTGYIHSDYLAKAEAVEIWLTVVNCNTSV